MMMGKELKILMLEDLEDDAVLIDRVLRRDKINFTRIRVDNREDFMEALEKFDPDIVLSDHSLPQFNSIEALEICTSTRPDLPFILVTGAVSEEFAVDCLKRGADDYILKSNLARLPRAMNYAIREHQHENLRLKQEALLLQQNKELVKINKEMDSFVYSVSHNLRSPLSSVLGVVNVAKLDSQKSLNTVDQYFSMIEGSILKLDETLREILDYSQNIRTDLAVNEVNLKSIVNTSLDKYSYLNGASNIQHQVELKLNTLFFSDNYRISIIIDNLISNAIRYTDPSKPVQFINIVAEVNPAYASIVIRDNGIGIGSQHLRNVFNMFFRATERSEGAGLGLYIVKEMIEKLKGSVNITSTLYEETVVSLSVPNRLMHS